MDRGITIRSGVSLVELLIAVGLLALVVLAISSIDIGSQQFFIAAEKESGVQNEATPAIEHVVKQARYGWELPNCDGGCTSISFKLDTDNSDGVGPFGSVTSQSAEYQYNSGLKEVRFRLGAGSWETIARNISNCAFTTFDTDGDGSRDRLRIFITATDPKEPSHTITLQSDVALRFSAYKI